MNMELRQCSPNAKTKSFALVLSDWTSLDLYSAGNAKAADMVRSLQKKAPVQVTITGEQTNDTIKVSEIARANQ